LIPGARGFGRGTEATAEILRYAARDLGLRQLRLLVRSDNGDAISLYARFGFQTEGELMDAEYRDGQFQNLLVMCVDLPKLQSERISSN
jgi:putative acetyltransferase